MAVKVAWFIAIIGCGLLDGERLHDGNRIQRLFRVNRHQVGLLVVQFHVVVDVGLIGVFVQVLV
jgi:hypothetical protein